MARKSTTTAAPAPEPVEAAPAEQQAEQVTITGRLCADPVLRHTKSGKAVTTIRLAVNEPGAEATFHSVVVWNRTAEVVCEYLRKGAPLRSPAARRSARTRPPMAVNVRSPRSPLGASSS